ncbi:MAG: hypothetical protein Q3985_04005 [Eubacteriales bacterium]|nr:hypothetical protein [Eubacteriales bacterium]
MARIKCKNCGKVYRYETEGCCPGCGAYNRPPRRESVHADGTVYHMSDNDFLENRYARVESQSGKVCFEEKACYEENDRYEEEIPTPEEPVVIAPMLNQTPQQVYKKKGNPFPLIVVGLVFLVAMIVNALESCSTDFDSPYIYGEPYLTQFTVLDGVATAYVMDIHEVEAAQLWYIDGNGDMQFLDCDSWTDDDGRCVMRFELEDDYQYADSLDIECEDNFTTLYIDTDTSDAVSME